MDSLTRRRFITRGMAATAGTLLSSVLIKGAPEETSSITAINQEASDEHFWKLVKSQFPVDEGLLYFNNGSLGPSPEYVIDKTEKYRRMLDGFPSKYMWGGWDDEKESVRKRVAEYFSAGSDEIALIHNTTEGMNLFAHSFDLKAGDEIILADHEHITGTATYQYFCEKKGVKIVRPVLPILPGSPEEITEIYRKAITPRTRLISMVHMTNTNGMILPVRDVSEMARMKGIITCVDGAQTAGMFRINLEELGCDCYAASGHKWLFGPKGTGVLYARRSVISQLEPLLLARNFREKEIRMFEDYNTRNLPDILGLGAAIDYNNMLGQEKKESRIYDLKHYLRDKIGNNPSFIFKTPMDDRLSAGIQVVEVSGKDTNRAKDFLFEEYGIDTRPMTSHNLNALRISLSVFNTKEDIDLLCDALTRFASI